MVGRFFFYPLNTYYRYFIHVEQVYSICLKTSSLILQKTFKSGTISNIVILLYVNWL